jgi:hypothetical protein
MRYSCCAMRQELIDPARRRSSHRIPVVADPPRSRNRAADHELAGSVLDGRVVQGSVADTRLQGQRRERVVAVDVDVGVHVRTDRGSSMARAESFTSSSCLNGRYARLVAILAEIPGPMLVATRGL